MVNYKFKNPLVGANSAPTSRTSFPLGYSFSKKKQNTPPVRSANLS